MPVLAAVPPARPCCATDSTQPQTLPTGFASNPWELANNSFVRNDTFLRKKTCRPSAQARFLNAPPFLSV